MTMGALALFGSGIQLSRIYPYYLLHIDQDYKPCSMKLQVFVLVESGILIGCWLRCHCLT